ncbi:uncharacterized protein RJT21DRAFT_115097 [Scheffersomyces amazonensis]|uniref:uncharacterized protein n=1 Tax=Scheffersomyces amazonensis TaxID=1078765 RepID=UPI00315D93B8
MESQLELDLVWTTKSRSITRSKGGCSSCKKLRIKCDENKPRCEYCQHTNRECKYPSTFRFVQSPRTKQRNRLKNLEEIFDLVDNLVFRSKNRQYPYHRIAIADQDLKETNLTNELILNQTTAQLRISKFELRLLNFFHNVSIHIFSHGLGKEAYDVWAKHVPNLFLQSPLVRNSIYSFASISLFPLCDLQGLRKIDDVESRVKFNLDISFDECRYNTNDKITNSLYIKTATYFMNTISGKNRLIAKKNQLEKDQEDIFNGPYLVDKQTAKELVISSILIFSYLGVHPHNLIPLVNFDTGDQQVESDFLSISKGIGHTTYSCIPTIRQTEFKPLFSYNNDLSNKKIPDYPIITILSEDLQSEYAIDNEIFTKDSLEYEVLRKSIDLLKGCIYKVIKQNFPVPLFRWILSPTQGFNQLVYQKNYYALRILYVFSCLSTMWRFHVFKDNNIWVDFVNWYGNHTFEIYGQDNWKYPVDRCLYNLALKKRYTFTPGVYSEFEDFDPELLDQVL